MPPLNAVVCEIENGLLSGEEGTRAADLSGDAEGGNRRIPIGGERTGQAGGKTVCSQFLPVEIQVTEPAVILHLLEPQRRVPKKRENGLVGVNQTRLRPLVQGACLGGTDC
jgi:hypothetical protein